VDGSLTNRFLSRTLRSALPQHPYVVDVEAKSALFDQLKANFKLSAVTA
jgi:hypothetical protein